MLEVAILPTGEKLWLLAFFMRVPKRQVVKPCSCMLDAT
jgi:hypothetical protein